MISIVIDDRAWHFYQKEEICRRSSTSFRKGFFVRHSYSDSVYTDKHSYTFEPKHD